MTTFSRNTACINESSADAKAYGGGQRMQMYRRTVVHVAAIALLLLLTAHGSASAGEDPAHTTSAPPTVFTNGRSSSGWLPFEFFDHRRIFIPAKINGRRTTVMLDSGASSTVIDKRFVKQLQIESKGNLTGEGTGGSGAYSVLHGVNITLGAITFHDTSAVGIDLVPVEKQLGHALPAVLGGDAFADCVVDIDFAKHRIAFRDPTSFQAPAGAVSVALKKSGENFAIGAVIEGRPASLVFDLGNASPLALFPRFWNQPGFVGKRPVSATKTGGFGGMHVQKLATIRELTIAASRFKSIPATLEDNTSETARSNGADGNIGLPVLSRFRLIIDLPQSRALFGLPVDTTTPFDANHTGLTVQPGDAGQKVLYVAPGSPADTAGIEAGDLITTLDGLSVRDWESGTRAQKAWIYGAPGTRIHIGFANGETKTLTFAKYF